MKGKTGQKNLVPVVKKCERCGNDFVASSNYVHFCEDCSIIVKREAKDRHNKTRLIAKQNKLLKEGVEGEDYIIDLWNGLPTTRIAGRWIKERHPGRTIDEYKKEFPDAPLVCGKMSKRISESTKSRMNRPEVKEYYSNLFKGDKNPNAKCNTTEEYRKSISPFSKSFKNYVGMTDKEKEKQIREYLQCDRDDRNTNQLKYWIKKGYSEEEAKQKVSERQTTFTLEKCIERYGEEEGTRRYVERQKNWSAKIEEQYQQGLFSKIPHSQNSNIYSKFEKDIVDSILESLDIDINDVCCYKTSQFRLENTNEDCKNKLFAYDFKFGNKIIEFNGDFWHMNPDVYDSDYVHPYSNLSAEEKWEIDEIKHQCALENGYNVLTIWEHEYNENKEYTIQKCIEFLMNDYEKVS
jgi:hypothetical protein